MKHTARFAILAALLFAGTAVFAADSDKNKTVKHDVTLKNGRIIGLFILSLIAGIFFAYLTMKVIG